MSGSQSARTYAPLTVFVVVALFLSACASAPGAAPQAGGNEALKVGIVTSLTGAQANFGLLHKRAYEMALEDINAAGGINGRPLAYILEDDASKPEQTVTVVEKLITQERVPALLGSYASATTATAAPTATKYQTPLVIPTGSEDEILQQGSKWLFRVCAPSSGFAKGAIDYLVDVAKVSSVAIVYENTNFGTSTSSAGKKLAEARGLKVVAIETYKPQDPDFKPTLSKIKAANPESIFFVSYLIDATLLMRQTKELDINPKIFVGAGAGFSDNEFIKPSGAGKNAEFTFASSQWTADTKWAGAKEVGAKYQAKYGDLPPYHFAQAYASLFVLADGLKRAGSTDKTKIREALAATNLQTIFGPVKFDATGQNDHPMVITQVQDGKFVTVHPGDIAAGQAKYPTPPWNARP